MGCWTGLGRTLLIIVNFVLLIVSLAILAGGILLKFFTPLVTPFLLGTDVSDLDSQTKKDFNIPDISDVTELPFVDEIGITLIALGGILFGISFLACCGACCKYRPLLIAFVILMSLLLIVQGVVGGLFLADQSVLHDMIKDSVGNKVKNEYERGGDDVFSFSIDILHYLVGCCGIRGWDDFSDDKPPSCCNRTIIDGDSSWDDERQNCTANPPTAPDEYYNPQGCYDLLRDKVFSDLTISAVVLGGILAIQFLEIVFACLIVKDVNDDNNKVRPY